MGSFMMIGVKGKAAMRRKPKCVGQTDGRTDGHGDSSIPPLTSLRGYNDK